jgi:hypothetical protein
VLGDHDALDLIGPFVDLGGLVRMPTLSTEAVIVWRVVHWVHWIKRSSPGL